MDQANAATARADHGSSGGLPTAIYDIVHRLDNLSLRILDVGIIAAAWMLAYGAGFELRPPPGAGLHALWIIGVPVLVQMTAHHVAGLYGPVWRYASVEEGLRVIIAVAAGVAASLVALAAISLGTGFRVPLVTAPPVAAMLVLLGCGGIRFQSRLFALERQQSGEGQLRALIVGAGSTGASLASELNTTDAGRGLTVIGFVDDDPTLAGRSVRGIPIRGSVDDLAAVCEEQDVDRILIALPDASSERLKAVVAAAIATKAQVKVLPHRSERAGGPLVRSVRDLDVTDLLGREHSPVDDAGIGNYLEGATVLVTGGGGSIGSEIARQVMRYRPGKLLLLDRDESLLHDTVTGGLEDAEPILIDVRDRARLDGLFAQYRPDVVFHAAAYKHVPMLERHPVEAVRTNVLGTWFLARAAAEWGCSRFVHISTDKAADPCSVMGATKRVAEQIVFAMGQRRQTPFVAVRFGNVLGSRGSVVPTFVRQIVEGGPVTVTDPEMTRYFMTIPEAVSLVLQSGAMAEEGRIHLLDMGPPVSILGLAHQMIRLAGLRPGEDVEIEVVGARPGERLHERLHDDAEIIEPGNHPSISALTPKVSWDWWELCQYVNRLEDLCAAGDPAVVRVIESMLTRSGVHCELQYPAPSDTIDLREPSTSVMDGQLSIDLREPVPAVEQSGSPPHVPVNGQRHVSNGVVGSTSR